MSARFPDFRVHDDRAIDADHGDLLAVGAWRRIADHVVPPGVLDVLFQFDAERAVVPEAVDAAVDFARLEDEAAPFAQGDEFVHVHDAESLSALQDTGRAKRKRANHSPLTTRYSHFLFLPAALDDAHGADFQPQRVAAQLRN